MKPVLLFLIFSCIFIPIVAQEKDSITPDITSLEKQKAEISTKVDELSEQLTQQFSLQQELRTKIQLLEEDLAQNRNERTRLQNKKELTTQEKKSVDNWKKIQQDKERLIKSFAEAEKRFNNHLVLLDKALGLRNELEERIRQLKEQK
jgi:chromosome segregation ATPase